MTDHAMTVEMPVRYRDIDAEGHVNNAVYLTYFEQARVEYIDTVLDVDALSPGVVVANVEIDYERPILFDDDVTVSLGVTDVGTTSMTMACDIEANGNRAASASSVIVAVDPETGSPRPLPEDWRDTISTHEGIDC